MEYSDEAPDGRDPIPKRYNNTYTIHLRSEDPDLIPTEQDVEALITRAMVAKHGVHEMLRSCLVIEVNP